MSSRRSWPGVIVGAVLAIGVGWLVWTLWLAPGGPTVQPPALPTPSQQPTVTGDAEASATPTPSATSTRGVPDTQGGEPSDSSDNNPEGDAIASYPGSPIGPSQQARDVVRVVQQRLVDLGAVLSVDGVFGPQTDRAVRDFQRERRLVVTGTVDQKTWIALFGS